MINNQSAFRSLICVFLLILPTKTSMVVSVYTVYKDQKVSRSDAVRKCKPNLLATISNERQMEQVKPLFYNQNVPGSCVWINMTYHTTSNTFTLGSGEKAYWYNWSPNSNTTCLEILYWGTQSNCCVKLDTKDFTMSNMSCAQPACGAICEISSIQASLLSMTTSYIGRHEAGQIAATSTLSQPSDSGTPALHYTVFYENLNRHLPWEEARRKCNQHAMGMVKVNNHDELYIFASYLENIYNQTPNNFAAWVGMYWNDTISEFSWNNGQPFTFETNWAKGHPDCNGVRCTSSDSCVIVDEDLKFQTVSCMKDKDVFCEGVKQIDPTITSVSTSKSMSFSTAQNITSKTLSLLSSSSSTADLSVFPFPSDMYVTEKVYTTSTPSTSTEHNTYGIFSSTFSSALSSSFAESVMSSSMITSVPQSLIAPSTVVIAPSTDMPSSQSADERTMTWSTEKFSYHAIATNEGLYDWNGAMAACKALRMDLLVIKDLETMLSLQDFLNNVFQFFRSIGIKREVWLGMVWNEKMQIHQWLDNKTVTWSNWRPMEPDCMSPTWSNVCHKQPFTDENCVVIGKMFLFGTADCTTKRVVICQEEFKRPKVLNCTCPLRNINKKWHFLDGSVIPNSQVAEIIEDDFNENVKPNISVNKTLLSKSVRKRTSADDDRPVAQSIGWTAVVLFCIPVGLFISLDIISFLRFVSGKTAIIDV